jgi:hypothetical protein
MDGREVDECGPRKWVRDSRAFNPHGNGFDFGCRVGRQCATPEPTGDWRTMDRAKRLAANREASAASRARKRALEEETRARCEALEHRVGQLLEHARALACENAGLKNALLEVTYGVRSVEFAALPNAMMFGSETAAMGGAKLPLPRWDGGAFAANAKAVTATEGATAKRQKTTGVVPDVRQQTSTSSGESSYDGSGALTTTTTTPASEVVLGDLTPLPFDFDDAFDYTRDAFRTKRSFSRGARATNDATTRQGARQRVDGCSLVAPRGRGPRAETSYAIQNMQTNATRQRMKDAAKRILTKRRRRTRSSTTCSSMKMHSMRSSMRFLPMKATISNSNPSSRASRRRKSTDDTLARQQKLIKQIVRRLYPNS